MKIEEFDCEKSLFRSCSHLVQSDLFFYDYLHPTLLWPIHDNEFVSIPPTIYAEQTFIFCNCKTLLGAGLMPNTKHGQLYGATVIYLYLRGEKLDACFS